MRIVAGRTPEVHVGEVVTNAVELDAFHEEEVLPQGAGVLTASGCQGTEVTDDCIPDAVVAEVDLLSFLEFVAEISGKGRTDLDDEALLQKLEIVGDCGPTKTGITCKAVVINFGAYVKGEQLDEVHEFVVLADARKCKKVLV